MSALDDEQLNFLDRHVIARVQEKGRALKRLLTREHGYLTRRESCTTEEDIHQLWEVRNEAISRFILAVSDTQLVTGLAVLIAGTVGVCRGTISGYELHVIISQAWLTSTTHLATLDALRNHLRSYGFVRDIRVVCMVMLLLLLTVNFGFLQAKKHTYGNGKVDKALEGGDGFVAWDTRIEIIGNVAWVAVLLLIWSNYITRIQDLYVKQKHPMYMVSALAGTFKRRDRTRLSHGQRFAELASGIQHRKIEKIKRSKGLTRTFHEAVYGYDGSFLSSMPGIFFCFAYGVVWNINIYAVIPGASHRCLSHGEIGFGQIVPLLLLLLPIFAVGATYYGKTSSSVDVVG